jgi:extracellular elastinolytic metalloproteinase
MNSPGTRSRSRKWLGAWAVTVVAVATLGVTGQSDGASPGDRVAPQRAARSGSGELLGNYDARLIGGDRRAKAATRQVRENGKAVRGLSRSLGAGAVIDIDPLTGTPDQVSARTSLTLPSGRSAASVALGFVREHLAGFGLDDADLDTLVKVRHYTDLNGITHVYWAQQVAGSRVFGNGLRAHVDKAGRLISVQGAPIAGLTALARRAPDSRIGRAAAIRNAVTDARLADPDARPGATAERVWFLAPAGLRPGWLTYTEPGPATAYEHVIDAATGATLYRRSTVAFDGSGDAFVHENYPGASGQSSGGRQHRVNLIKLGFLQRHANFPKGKYATVWADVNDDNRRQDRETTRLPKSREQALRMRLKPFKTAPGELRCTKHYICTWDPSTARSWRRNMAQDAIQGLYLISNYAKWLARPPFGFNRSSGNFTRKDHDPVDLNALDGANTDHGFPDAAHVNNANFNTPPDGRRPRMQMYLNYSPYLAASSSDDFLTLGHEFTHGLSNRLVVNSNNHSTLNSYQAGAMGEAWSDFYAFDYLLTRHFTTNTDDPGELTLDLYLAKNKAGLTRTEAIDCGLGEAAANCVQLGTGDPGGYTYDDVGDGQLGTEVHDAGEVWAQLLFDIWEELGHRVTMAITTEGMRLSADDPSMLDMRDAILAADEAIYGGYHTDALWEAFAARGFGFYAGSDDGSDAAPVADFNTPPPPGTPTGSIVGTVADRDGSPLPGAVVRVAGHSEYSDVTDADGNYEITDVISGTWPKVTAAKAGYEPHSEAVTVDPGGTATFDASLRRDWASASGGGSIAGFTGPDYTNFGCGPINAIDLSQGAGWGSDTTADGSAGDSEDDIDPKQIVIELPQTITATAFGVNPTATCGDAGSASTKDFEIYVAETPDGPWGSPVAEGTFTADDRGQLVEVPLSSPVANVGAIKYVMLSPQVPDWSGCPFDFSGCQFMDTTEIAAYDD